MPHAKGVVFPYGIRLREGGIVDTFPVAEVAFPNKDGDWISLFFVIDSGATLSALPKSDSPALGVQAEDGKLISISGIGAHPITGWVHQMKARLGEEIITFPIAFLASDSAPRVLGRGGIFERFTIVFDELHQRSGLLKATTAEARQIRKILDQVSH